MTAGLVFFISEPIVGSNATRQISPLFMGGLLRHPGIELAE